MVIWSGRKGREGKGRRRWRRLWIKLLSTTKYSYSNLQSTYLVLFFTRSRHTYPTTLRARLLRLTASID